MARSSGQIIQLLEKLEKSSKKQALSEVGAKKKEAKQHKTLFLAVQKEMEKASNKASKGAKWGNILGTILSLAGMGPIGQAVGTGIGTLVGGGKGVKEAKEYIQGIDIGRKTKFGGELEEFERGIGSDLIGDALNKALTTAMTAATADKFLGIPDPKVPVGGGAPIVKKSILDPEQLDKIIEKNIGKPVKTIGKGIGKGAKWVGEQVEKVDTSRGLVDFWESLKEIPRDIDMDLDDLQKGDLIGGVLQKLRDAGKSVVKSATTPTGVKPTFLEFGRGWEQNAVLKNLFGGFGKTKMLPTLGGQLTKNALSTLLTQQKLKKMEDPYRYDMPYEMSRPTNQGFGGYR